MNKKFCLILAILLLLILVVSFAGCDDDPCEGEIIKKEFLEEHTEVRTITTFIYTGKVCIPVVRPYSYHYPDRWKVTIQWYSEGKFHTREIWVTEECYNKVTIGDWFVYDKNFCSYTEPCEKSKER